MLFKTKRKTSEQELFVHLFMFESPEGIKKNGKKKEIINLNYDRFI